MILFFVHKTGDKIYTVQSSEKLTQENISKLEWLLEGKPSETDTLDGFYLGPRKEMITPWSTNAVEITQNMAIEGIIRIEEFIKVADEKASYDPMLKQLYTGITQESFVIDQEPEPVRFIDDVTAYNKQEGLAMNADEVQYLDDLSIKLGRKLTDSEVFGFSQVNSEHCRHKIFNGTFIIDGEEKEKSLFRLIRDTTEENNNKVVSAYKDNVAFVAGPEIEQFAPATQHKGDFFKTEKINSVISVKAETHNFPTTVEPFNGAATGAGGEIRDRMAGGKASMPLAGTAVYMTSYSRLEEKRPWETATQERPWLYQTPMDILIKASDGASDFGNKFGQPMIAGSVLTFEHAENNKMYGYDKVIMLAGGVGYGRLEDALKETPKKGDKVVVLGGDNYRIGMGGSAVSSVATGEFNSGIELNAVQRSNPEMQKRVANVVRAMSEKGKNPIISIHDHGAGGHLNCLSELVEERGGTIDISKLPVGDPTLSSKEIVGNESQERMGLVIEEKYIEEMKTLAERERAPMYVVGEITGDMQFKFEDKKTGQNPIDLQLADMFGNPPKTIMDDVTIPADFSAVKYDQKDINTYVEGVLQLDAVACKDWLTNKVDRSVTGKVAAQQTVGELQIPLNNVGVMALDYRSDKGIATSIGHAPVSALIDPKAGSQMSIAESLTNMVWAPIEDGIKGVSLSANWMWPCNNPGEDARLYSAVEATSKFAIELGLNIPTGKDSLSMVQKYKDGETVYAPGTVIISAGGEVTDIRKVVEPVLVNDNDSKILYIDFSSDDFKLGGSSFAQLTNKLGVETPSIKNSAYFKSAFTAVQELVEKGLLLSGHDISAGGLITTLLEINFANTKGGLAIDLADFIESDLVKVLFSENSGIIIQVKDEDTVRAILAAHGISAATIGQPQDDRRVDITFGETELTFDIETLRDTWYKTSYLFDKKQSTAALAKERFETYAKNPIHYKFTESFKGTFEQFGLTQDRVPSGTKAAIIREKGVNGDREMAYSMYLAGFDVKDIHMTDLIAGREDLSDVNFIVFVGGFSNSDVLGSAKGWAGAFLYNPKAKVALDNFFAREDTMSLGVCNGCQLMMELGLIFPNKTQKPTMLHNNSGKFESTFLSVEVPENNSIMLSSLAGSKLGIWVAHGEGNFNLPEEESAYNIAMKYAASTYPANPNGATYNTAGVTSEDGRHLAMMPHLERAIFPWQCGTYPTDKKQDDVTPWIEAFVNAKNWVAEKSL
jgi:phosphoribosylformylglycinamidine synthase